LKNKKTRNKKNKNHNENKKFHPPSIDLIPSPRSPHRFFLPQLPLQQRAMSDGSLAGFASLEEMLDVRR